jgi:hypothetical protein
MRAQRAKFAGVGNCLFPRAWIMLAMLTFLRLRDTRAHGVSRTR